MSISNKYFILIPYLKYLAFTAIIIIGITSLLKDKYVSTVLAAALPIIIWGLVMYIKGHNLLLNITKVRMGIPKKY